MILKVIKESGVVLEEEVTFIRAMTSEGEIEILPKHAGAIILLGKGKLTYDNSFLKIAGGLAKITSSEVTVFSGSL